MQTTKSGFTIIELLVVITVIGVLSTIGVFSFTTIQSSTRDTQRSSKITIISEALEKYYSQHGEYPSCNAMIQPVGTVVANTLIGVDPSNLTTPSAAIGTNSFADLTTKSCNPTVITNSATILTADVFAYVGDNSAKCLTASGPTAACLQYTLKYRQEASGNTISLVSRHTIPILATPAAPTTTVTLNGGNVLATVTPVICPVGSYTQYGINSRINGGSWSGYTAWDTITNAIQPANQGVKYEYQSQARCYPDSTATSASNPSVGAVSNAYVNPIATIPTVPVVTANTVGATTTWSWPASSGCAGGTSVNYRYDYTISPSGYDSGWVTTASTSVAFTTSTQGQTYLVTVQAQCTNANASGGWSGSGSASYFSPYTPPALSIAASLTSITAGQSTTLTLTSDKDVNPTPYYLKIYDQTTGVYLASAKSGTTLTYIDTPGATQTYIAQATDSTGSTVYSSSSTITVNVTAIAGTQTWTTPGTYTFTVPAGVTQLTVLCQGGGGGGGGGNTSYNIGSSGGNGGLVLKTYTVSPGAVFTIIVGAGGAGATWGYDAYSNYSISSPTAGSGSQVSASGYATLSTGGGSTGYNNFGTNTLNPSPGGTASGGNYNEIGASGNGIFNYSQRMGGAATLFGTAGSSGTGNGYGTNSNGLGASGGNGGDGEVMINYSSGTHSTQTWTTPGTYTFTVPAGVTQLTVLCQGGGGGGGGNNASGQVGSSGGNGGLVLKTYTVSPGAVFTIIVGTGGLGAIWDTTPSLSSPVAGTTSQVSASGYATLSAGGGNPGYSNFGTNTLNTPAGGTASGGDNNEIGASGGGVYNYYYRMGGATTLFGAAGSSGVGDGGISHNGGAYSDGGNGGNGEVIINY